MWEAARGQPYRGSWLMLGYRPVPLQGSLYRCFIPTSSNLSICRNLPDFVGQKWTFSSTSPWAGTIHRYRFSLAIKEEASDIAKEQMKQGGCARHPMEALAQVRCRAGDDGPCLARGPRSRSITSSRAAHLRNSVGSEALCSVLFFASDELLGLVEGSWGLFVLCVEIWFSFGDMSLLATLSVFGWPLAELPFASGVLA